MQPKKEKEPAVVVQPEYKPLPPSYEPHEPSESQKRVIRRIKRKKR